MKPIRISAVSYLNTYPFVYGMFQSGFLQDFRLDLEVPSLCAENLASGKSDIALVPVGAIPDFKKYTIVSGFCIGAVSKVKTVLLLSRKPLPEIKEIALDSDSRTSVQLVKVLALNYWKISPHWKDYLTAKNETGAGPDSLVAIGDKTFRLAEKYPYIYDLAEEWIKFTSLPFVFAVWLSTRKISAEIKIRLDKALEFGVSHIAESLEFFKDKLPAGEDCSSYLRNNISFIFDEKKKEGMNLFLNYLRE